MCVCVCMCVFVYIFEMYVFKAEKSSNEDFLNNEYNVFIQWEKKLSLKVWSLKKKNKWYESWSSV